MPAETHELGRHADARSVLGLLAAEKSGGAC